MNKFAKVFTIALCLTALASFAIASSLQPADVKPRDAKQVTSKSLKTHYQVIRPGHSTLDEETDFPSTAAPVAINDHAFSAMPLDITDDFLIEDINVTVGISHTYVSDMSLWLVGPNGDSLLLVDNAPTFIAGANMDNTVFDDEAATAFAYTAGGAPYTGSYRPLNDLAYFDGFTTAGTWYLVGYDNEDADTGTLDYFTLTVTHEGTGPSGTISGTVTVSGTGTPIAGVDVEVVGGPSTTTIANGSYSVTLAPGTYTVNFSKEGYEPESAPGVAVVDGQVTDVDAQMTAIASSETDFASTAAAVAIPDFGGGMAAMSLVVSQNLTISDLNLTVNITHTYVSDLIFWLVSPAGDSVQLTNHVVAPVGANMTNTVFDDEAATAFAFTGTGAPYTGTFRPLEPFSILDGSSTLGTWFLVAVDNEAIDVGTIDDFTLHVTHALAIGDLPEGIPSQFALHGAYPNPFNPSTSIVFSLPVTSDVELSVFNSLGQNVATLVNGTMNAGSHTMSFNAADLPSGLYFAQLRAGSFVSTQKLVLMK